MGLVGALGLFALAASSCGGPSRPPGDAGQDQGGVDPDLGPDATVDSGPRVDQGPSGCFAEGPTDVALDPSGAPIAFALAGGHSDFALAYVVAGEGPSHVALRRVSHDNVLGAETSLADEGTNTRAHEPVLVRTDVGWLAGWTALPLEGEPAQGTVRGRALLPDLTPDDSEDGAERELAGPGAYSPSFATTGGRVYFAYVAPTDEGPRVFHRALDGAGSPLADALPVSAVGVTPVRARNVGAAVGGYVAWTQEDGHVFGRRVVSSSLLDPRTSTLSDPTPAPTGVFALGNSGVVHAAVYGVEDRGHRGARIRIITETGNPASQPDLLRTPSVSVQVTAFALARFAAGFALVYRAKSPGQNRVRLLLHDSDGLAVFDVALAVVFEAEGDVAVAQATDGTHQLAWIDRDLEGVSHLITARLTCRP